MSKPPARLAVLPRICREPAAAQLQSGAFAETRSKPHLVTWLLRGATQQGQLFDLCKEAAKVSGRNRRWSKRHSSKAPCS